MTTEPRPVYTGTPRPTADQINFARECLSRHNDVFYWWSVLNSLTESLGEIQRWHFEECRRTGCMVCFYLSRANATVRAHELIQTTRRDPASTTDTTA